eukprot:COSAG01_NODE_8841_length_2640_cov_3.086974_2_plen_138_part_00
MLWRAVCNGYGRARPLEAADFAGGKAEQLALEAALAAAMGEYQGLIANPQGAEAAGEEGGEPPSEEEQAAAVLPLLLPHATRLHHTAWPTVARISAWEAGRATPTRAELQWLELVRGGVIVNFSRGDRGAVLGARHD